MVSKDAGDVVSCQLMVLKNRRIHHHLRRPLAWALMMSALADKASLALAAPNTTPAMRPPPGSAVPATTSEVHLPPGFVLPGISTKATSAVKPWFAVLEKTPMVKPPLIPQL